MRAKSTLGADLLGASRLALDAVAGVTELVEAVHMTVLDKALGARVLQPAVRPVAGVTRLVYRSVKSVTRAVGGGVEHVARRLVPLPGSDAAWPGRVAVVAALNGVLGDRLAASDNPLAISMHMRRAGPPSARIVVLVHGLCMHGAQWLRDGVDHGAMLAAERGYCPVNLDYNSGRHTSDNGREFAAQLQALVDGWPVPVQEIVMVAHSMGGLVARSACHYGELAASSWRARLTTLVFLGTPHYGAPLERGGNWIGWLTEGSSYSAPFARLARLRSEGITDLRHGSVLAAHWQGQDRFAASIRPITGLEASIPAPHGVRYFAIGATIGAHAGDLKDRLLCGDGLVPLPSALGESPGIGADYGFEKAVVCATNHLQLLSSPQVRTHLLAWL